MKKSITLLLLILIFNSCSSVATSDDTEVIVDENITENNTTLPIEDTNITKIIVNSEDIVPIPKGVTQAPPNPPVISLRGIRGDNQDTKLQKD